LGLYFLGLYFLGLYFLGLYFLGLYFLGLYFLGLYFSGLYFLGLYFLGLYFLGLYFLGLYFLGLYFSGSKKLFEEISEQDYIFCGDKEVIKSRMSEIISKFKQHQINKDISRMQNSNFIPLYKTIKTHANIEPYLLLNLPIRVSSLMCQLRLSIFRIKMNNTKLEINEKCKLCNSREPCSLNHMLYDCVHLISSRKNYLRKYLPNTNKTFCEMYLPNIKNVDFFQDLARFFQEVVRLHDLCELV